MTNSSRYDGPFTTAESFFERRNRKARSADDSSLLSSTLHHGRRAL